MPYPYSECYHISHTNTPPVTSHDQALEELSSLSSLSTDDTCLILDGPSLSLLLSPPLLPLFATCVLSLPAVVCCRCSPTQKADVVRMVEAWSGKGVLAVGDGGNDVSMIQAANVGMKRR